MGWCLVLPTRRYGTYKLVQAMPGGEVLTGFTRILHRVHEDECMDEVRPGRTRVGRAGSKWKQMQGGRESDEGRRYSACCLYRSRVQFPQLLRAECSASAFSLPICFPDCRSPPSTPGHCTPSVMCGVISQWLTAPTLWPNGSALCRTTPPCSRCGNVGCGGTTEGGEELGME